MSDQFRSKSEERRVRTLRGEDPKEAMGDMTVYVLSINDDVMGVYSTEVKATEAAASIGKKRWDYCIEALALDATPDPELWPPVTPGTPAPPR
jgi:hypothetical protein